jgi:hypothetical protein
MVKDDIAHGSLVRLDFPLFDEGEYSIYAIHNVANPPGLAARWLTSEVRARLSRAGKSAEDFSTSA